VKALETGGKVRVTKENAGSISLLAKEFWLEDLLAECSVCQIASTSEPIAALSEQISKLERQISSQPLTIVAELKESIANHERQLESLDCRISALEPTLTAELKELKSGSLTGASTPRAVPPVSPPKLLKAVEFPLKKSKSPKGIISYLTRKYGGNIHDKGIVTITSKSVDVNPEYALQNIADLASRSEFCSREGPDEWVCWDFHEMRVQPTHYTVRCWSMKSWMVEGSLDVVNWTEIDQKTDISNFSPYVATASFAVSRSAESRFIRLTMTDKTHEGYRNLLIQFVEFFGTLLE
jgi:hypothetical protein